MKRLFLFVISISYMIVTATSVLAQESGWRNFTWGMSESQMAKKCGNKSEFDRYLGSYTFLRGLLKYHGIEQNDNTVGDVAEKIYLFNCKHDMRVDYTDTIMFKGKFIAVVKNLESLDFDSNPSVQRNIIDQLKSAYPGGAITTQKSGYYEYPAFQYKSSNIEIYNDDKLLIIISSQGTKSIIDAYNSAMDKQKFIKEKNMKIF